MEVVQMGLFGAIKIIILLGIIISVAAVIFGGQIETDQPQRTSIGLPPLGSIDVIKHTYLWGAEGFKTKQYEINVYHAMSNQPFYHQDHILERDLNNVLADVKSRISNLPNISGADLNNILASIRNELKI